MGEKGQSSSHMPLHVSQLWEVDHVLQYLAHNHDLALYGLQWSTFRALLSQTVHGSHISPQFQVCEDLNELMEVFCH